MAARTREERRWMIFARFACERERIRYILENENKIKCWSGF